MEPHTQSINQIVNYASAEGDMHQPFHWYRSTSLCGTLTGAAAVHANTAKRRTHGSTLLSSPARLSHGANMTSIFRAAQSNIVKGSRSPSSLSSRALPFRTRPLPVDENRVIYPSIPKDADQTSSTVSPQAPREDDEGDQRENCTTTFEQLVNTDVAQDCSPNTDRVGCHFQSPAGRTKSGRVLPGSTETIKPNHLQRALARPSQPQIVPMNEIESMQMPRTIYSTSSASWTGDSEYFKPRVLPLEQRKSSIPEWLEHLPAEPDDFENDPAEQGISDDASSLSPHVEIVRGSMRRRVRRREVRKRCPSYNDEDIFN